MHEVFEEDDMRQLFRWLTKFVNNPYSEDDQLVPAGLQVILGPCICSLSTHLQQYQIACINIKH